MLREHKNARFERRLTLIGFRYHARLGAKSTTTWGSRLHRALLARQELEPAVVAELDGRQHWVFEGRFWWDDDGLEPRDALALIRQRDRRRRRQLDNARAELELEARPTHRREPVPRELRRAVFARDGGACVECGARFDLQYDHVIPVSRGGATSLDNLQVLCGDCNRAKGSLIA